MAESAFKLNNNNLPVIIQFISEHFRGKEKQLFELVRSTLKDSLYQPARKLAKFPSVHSLQNKFLVYCVDRSDANWPMYRSWLLTDEPIDATTAEETIYLNELHENLSKVSFWHSFSIECNQLMCQVETSVPQGVSERNQWPTICEQKLISLDFDDDDEKVVPPEEDAQKWWSRVATNCIQVGVQLIPVEPDNIIGRALFRLNGNCGYVTKPKYLRKGQLYKHISEDKLLKDEVPSRVLKCALKIICAENVMHYQRNMHTWVTMRIVGHEEDAKHSFSTRVCSSDGLVPFWNEQTRFRIRIPDLAFFYFEVKNYDQVIGYHVIPVKTILKGNRHMQLYDQNHQPIQNAKLYVHFDYKEIVGAWGPKKNDEKQPNEPKGDSSKVETAL